MRILLLMLLSVTVFGQKVNEEKIRKEYAIEFASSEHRAHLKITENLWKQPYFLGDVFECPKEFEIYKEDCPPDTISMDADMWLKVPVGTIVQLTGERRIGLYKLYEIRVDLPEEGVIRTYLHTFELDDLFFPGNNNPKKSFYMDFEKRDSGIRQKLMAKYKLSPERLDAILGDMN